MSINAYFDTQFTIIILFEIVVGTFSAAILTDELFGWREVLGSSFIILAGLTEIIFASNVAIKKNNL